jgi:hypothetical protein
MEKLDLMRKFMQTFVGGGFYLIIKDHGSYFLVYSVEIYQKEDESCPPEGVPVGGYFMRLLVRSEGNREAAILCDWSEELLENLLKHYEYAKESGYNMLLMERSPLNRDDWLLLWGDEVEKAIRLDESRDDGRWYIT